MGSTRPVCTTPQASRQNAWPKVKRLAVVRENRRDDGEGMAPSVLGSGITVCVAGQGGDVTVKQDLSNARHLREGNGYEIENAMAHRYHRASDGS